jgi:hypothetical protein
MKAQTLWRWEQDGRGGEHGTATYFPGTPHEIAVVLPCFKQANALYNSISKKIEHTRLNAREGLLAEIARIRP